MEGEGVDGEGVDGEGVDVEEVEEPATDANTVQKTNEAGQPPPPSDTKAGCDADANTTAASRVPSWVSVRVLPVVFYECVCLYCSSGVQDLSVTSQQKTATPATVETKEERQPLSSLSAAEVSYWEGMGGYIGRFVMLWMVPLDSPFRSLWKTYRLSRSRGYLLKNVAVQSA